MIYGKCKLLVENTGQEFELYIIGQTLYSARNEPFNVQPSNNEEQQYLARVTLETYILEDGKPVFLQMPALIEQDRTRPPMVVPNVVPVSTVPKKRKLQLDEDTNESVEDGTGQLPK